VFHSGETRWFFEEPLPRDLVDWFASKESGKSEAARTDAYLLLPHCGTASVKLREGRLEVKANTCPREAVTYANGITGYRDTWVKWSSKADDAGALTSVLGASGNTWRFVRKIRCLRSFSLDGGSPVEVDPAHRLERGCQVELTSLRAVSGSLDAPILEEDWSSALPWWSLSLEAFAPETATVTSDVLSHMDVVANHLFRDPPPKQLTQTSSMAYPTWLLGIR
jgi:hypothetical protein